MKRLKAYEEEIKKYYKLLYKPKPRLEPLRSNYLRALELSNSLLKEHFNEIYNSLSHEDKQKATDIAFKANEKLSKVQTRIQLNTKHVLVSIEEESEEEAMTTMTPIDVQKAVCSTIPDFDGTPANLQSFVDAVELIQITITEHPDVVRRALITKLKGQARNFITSEENTVNAIIKKLKENIKPPSSKDVIGRLSALKRKDDAETFAKEVDALAKKLTEAYIQCSHGNGYSSKQRPYSRSKNHFESGRIPDCCSGPGKILAMYLRIQH